jgi:hypothetical protein
VTEQRDDSLVELRAPRSARLWIVLLVVWLLGLISWFLYVGLGITIIYRIF